MSGSVQPPIEPVDDDGVRAISVGLVLWALAGAVLLLLRDDLAERGAQWWLWTVLAGLAIGVGMLLFTRRRAAVYRQHRAAARTGHGSAGATRSEPDTR